MSLDLSNKKGVAYTAFATPQTTDLSTLTAAAFTAGDSAVDSGTFIVFVDSSAGAIALAPATDIEGLESGDVMKVTKGDTSSNPISFTDPVTGAEISFINRQLESYELIFDGAQWIFAF